MEGNDIYQFWRGGGSLVAKPYEVKIDRETGKTPKSGNQKGMIARGISLYSNKDKARRKDVPYRVVSLPQGLTIEQRGRDPDHYEIVPEYPITLKEYQQYLNQVVLIEDP